MGEPVIIDARSVPQPDDVALLMTRGQAEVLYELLGSVVGHPVDTYRGDTSAMWLAFATAGFEHDFANPKFTGAVTATPRS